MEGAPGPRAIPEAARRFVELVNRGDYWDSHEVLEGPWRASRSGFYHGLILYASAFVHAQRGKPRGILAQLAKAEAALAAYPEAYLGFDLAAIRAHAARCRECVDALRDEAGTEVTDWTGALPMPSLTLCPTRLRGDEEELGPRP